METGRLRMRSSTRYTASCGGALKEPHLKVEASRLLRPQNGEDGLPINEFDAGIVSPRKLKTHTGEADLASILKLDLHPMVVSVRHQAGGSAQRWCGDVRDVEDDGIKLQRSRASASGTI